jgi:hypothetical protein
MLYILPSCQTSGRIPPSCRKVLCVSIEAMHIGLYYCFYRTRVDFIHIFQNSSEKGFRHIKPISTSSSACHRVIKSERPVYLVHDDRSLLVLLITSAPELFGASFFSIMESRIQMTTHTAKRVFSHFYI